MSIPKITVTVIMSVYNNAKYVSQAIDSVLSQKTNFDYGLVILEDCSTDGTQDILIEYKKQYRSKIRLKLAKENKNDNREWARTIQQSQASFVALLDGDDFWTSSDKLQKQVNYLNSHPDSSFSFHNVVCFYEDKSKNDYLHTSPNRDEICVLEDLLFGNFIGSCSPVFRKNLVRTFPSWFYKTDWVDWALYILLAEHGPIGFIKETMGAYRIHEKGYFSGMDQIEKLQRHGEFYALLKQNYSKHNYPIQYMLSRIFGKLSDAYKKTGDIMNSKEYLSRSFVEYPFQNLQECKNQRS